MTEQLPTSDSSRGLEPSKVAWGVLIGSVITYNLATTDGQTLSEGFGRALHSKYGILPAAAAAMVCAHLLDLFPEGHDPIQNGFNFVRDLVRTGDDAIAEAWDE